MTLYPGQANTRYDLARHALSIASEVVWKQDPKNLVPLTVAWLDWYNSSQVDWTNDRHSAPLPAAGPSLRSSSLILRIIVHALLTREDFDFVDADVTKIRDAVRAAAEVWGLRGATLLQLSEDIATEIHEQLSTSTASASVRPAGISPRQSYVMHTPTGLCDFSNDRVAGTPYQSTADLYIDEAHAMLKGSRNAVALAAVPGRQKAMVWLALMRYGATIGFRDVKQATRTSTTDPENIRKFVSFGNSLLEQLIGTRVFSRISTGVYRISTGWSWEWCRLQGAPETSLLLDQRVD